MKKIFYPILGLGLIGFLDSLYLTISHFNINSVVCDGTNTCDLVLTSSYSVFMGIPLALYGMIFYAYIIIISALALDKIKKGSALNPKLLTPFAFVGFLASVYFTYIQAFVINAYCTFCLISATTSTLIFILAIINCRKSSKSISEVAKIDEKEKSA